MCCVLGPCTLIGFKTKHTKHLPQADDKMCSSNLTWNKCLIISAYKILLEPEGDIAVVNVLHVQSAPSSLILSSGLPCGMCDLS